MKLNLILILICTICLSAQAQRFDINTVKCKLSNDDMTYLNRVGQFEAKFYNVVFNTTVNDSLPIKINIYGNRDDYNKLEKDAINTTFIGGFYSSRVNETFLYKADRYMEVMLHETSHNMLRNNMRNPPQWLNEGIATLFGYLVIQKDAIYYNRQPYYINMVKSAIYQGKFSLAGYFNYRPTDWYDKDKRDYLYAVAYCLVYFFVKDDIENLQNMLLLMKQGFSTQAALTKTFGSFDRFEKRFADFYKPEVGFRN